MKKIEELFKQNDGMTVDGSTVEERHEIWKLLFEKNLICDKKESLELEFRLLGNNSFYFSGSDNNFVIEFVSFGIPVTNVSFKEFEDRLAQL